jgi:hypothetical protein
MLMLCCAHTHRAVRGHARRAAGTCHMAFVPRRLSGSLARGGRGRGGRAGGGGGRAGCRGRGRTEGRLCCVCVFRAWPLCVLATGVAADEFAGRGVVGSVSAAEPPRITDVSPLLSYPLSSRLPRYGQHIHSVCTYIPMGIWQQTPTPAEHCPAAFFPSLYLSVMGCLCCVCTACLTD